MKFRELFNDDLSYNWEKILSIKEFKDLVGAKQNTAWHQEGDVFEHTKLVCEQMLKELDYECYGNEYRILMLSAALCHDLGKPSTTYWDEKEQQWKCKSHGQEGAKITRCLFYDEDFELREEVCAMVEYHMILHHIFDGGEERAEKKMRELSKQNVSLFSMIILNYCDSMGTKNEVETQETIGGRMDRMSKLACKVANTTHCDTESDSKEQTVYVMIGIPGAGKNYYIKTTDWLSELPCASRDDIREGLGLNHDQLGTPAIENKVTNILNNKIRKWAEEGKSFVINNTNLKRKYRDDYKKILGKYNLRWVYVYVEAPSIETNFERRQGENWKNVITRMLRNFEFPSAVEYDELIIQKDFQDKAMEVTPFIDFSNF